MVLSAFPGLWWLFPWLYYFLSHVRNVFFYNLFQYLLRPFLFFWDLCNSNVGTCNIVSEVSEAVLISFHLFSFFSLSVISSYLSTSWLIHSSASVILLLIPSSVFFKPVAVLFSTVCLFFSFSLSLNLKHFLYFLDPWLFYFWDLESSLLLWFFFSGGCLFFLHLFGLEGFPLFFHQYHIYCYIFFPDSSVGKEPTCNAGDPDSIPVSGKFTLEGISYPLHILGLPLWLSW